MIDILTGTAFDATKRFNHREDEVALEFPSSVSSRRRNLNALKAQNWRASGGPSPFAGTEITVDTTVGGSRKSKAKTLYSIALLDPSVPATIDWGDGNVEQVVADATNLAHTYSSDGIYTIRISDDISGVAWSPNGATGAILTAASGVTSFKAGRSLVGMLPFGFNGYNADSVITSVNLGGIVNIGQFGISGVYSCDVVVPDSFVGPGTAQNDVFGNVTTANLIFGGGFTELSFAASFRSCRATTIQFLASDMTRWVTDRTWSATNAYLKFVRFPNMTTSRVLALNVTTGLGTSVEIICKDGRIIHDGSGWVVTT